MIYKKVWVAYEKTDLSLPIAIADTARELARMVGVKEKTVVTEASRWKSGKAKSIHERFARIEVEVDEDESDD